MSILWNWATLIFILVLECIHLKYKFYKSFQTNKHFNFVSCSLVYIMNLQLVILLQLFQKQFVKEQVFLTISCYIYVYLEGNRNSSSNWLEDDLLPEKKLSDVESWLANNHRQGQAAVHADSVLPGIRKAMEANIKPPDPPLSSRPSRNNLDVGRQRSQTAEVCH